MERKNKFIKSQNLAETQKRFIYGVITLIAFTLTIIFVFGDHGLFQLYKLKKEKSSIQKHISELRKEREVLISEKKRLENDLMYIEKLAREKYRMAKPGE
ncbi:MAG: septum formation initiator family protein, partial [Candidatus Neomarinimicrobiota bacterium]